MRPGSGFGRGATLLRQALVENSPLRRADPRAKLLLCLCASLTVMLPLERLLFSVIVYLGLVIWARLLPEVLRQVWRLRWLLLILFVLDAWLVSLELAVTITVRLALLSSVFHLLFATTTAREMGLALESLRLPYRYAFSLSLAMNSLGVLEEEWQAIREAQTVRGALPNVHGWRKLVQQIGSLVALTVPAILLTTRRAWAATEAAYTRGFDSPHRRPFQRLLFTSFDWALVLLSGAVVLLLFFWRLP